jgi:putative transcriptional regulator
VASKKTSRKRTPHTVGESVVHGLKEAIAWTEGKNDKVRVTIGEVPEVDVRKVRLKMGFSQAQFATRFGLPPATLRNWEQGRSRPDAPTRVLLAVIAKHPEAVADVLEKAQCASLAASTIARDRSRPCNVLRKRTLPEIRARAGQNQRPGQERSGF